MQATQACKINTERHEQRAVAMAALGCVQVAGAASLGEGRLGAFRVEIFRRCLAGTALDERATSTRWVRLLGATRSAPAELEPFLERAAVHGWQRVAVDLDPGARAALVGQVAERWADSGADHVVFGDRCDPWTATPDLGGVPCRVEPALSGVELLTIG